MVKRIFLSSIASVLTVSSAFATTLPANTATYENTPVIIRKLSSIGIETPLTASGAQSAPVHVIKGEASIDSARCLIKGCIGMPKPSLTEFRFKSSVIEKNARSQRLFGACRRAIESARANDLIILTGNLVEIERAVEGSSMTFEFTSLTDCAVERSLPATTTN